MIEDRLVDALAELADTLLDDFDVIDFLHLLVERCTELLEADAAGVLLTTQHGPLQLVAASEERTRLTELFQLQTEEGPSLEAFRSGVRVAEPDLHAARTRWPRFALASIGAGFDAVTAIPMRQRGETIGALNIFRRNRGDFGERYLQTAQALADVATIGLFQQRPVRHYEFVTEQLQAALQSRVVVEQAKGFVAERLAVDMATAFTALRGYASGRGLKLSVVAASVIEGELGAQALLASPDDRG
ncbi:GAF and ANTAR domain-containing protein [Amycolatopsis orientalis]|uniref:GAF and ANTAR domain-containing protein n=1 Tax=Amycolatopsis orientalis TaxID=31958 RepID=UPI000415C95E|nr:GAF and ANTAR domain-containing protein [Amycolatopsis orientalis]